MRLSAEFGRRIVALKEKQPVVQTGCIDPHDSEEERESWEFIQEESCLSRLRAGSHAVGLGALGEESLDDIPLERLRPQTSVVDHEVLSDALSSDCSLDQLSSSSSSESDSISTDRERRAAIDGEANARDLVPPSDLAGKICFRRKKPCKLHIVKSDSCGVLTFYCGRKAGSNYIRLDETPAFDGSGCIVCFNCSSSPVNDSDSS